MPLTIAIFVGSLRAGSFNRQLANAMTRLPSAGSHTFDFVEIGDLPLYNQDDDTAQPASVLRMKDQIAAADGVMFVSPEYNRSIPGVLKNAIDHGSRPNAESAWTGKPAGIIGTSQGGPGTAMMQQHLRAVLAHLDMPTLNQPEAFIQWKDGMIGADGTLQDKTAGFIDKWLSAFLAHVEAHRKA